MQKQLYTQNMVYGMTYRGDCVGTGKAVILHSENQRRPLPPPSPVEREPEGNMQIENFKLTIENEQNYEHDKANANARILLLPGHDDGNEVRDCW